MRRKVLRIVLVAGICVSMLCPPESVLACGPFFPEVIFTYSDFPGMPMKRFVGGQLGILQPTFSRKYLFVAYRYLGGEPLRDAEQKALLTLVRRENEDQGDGADPVVASRDWLMERGRVPGIPVSPKEIDTDRSIQIHMRAPGEKDFNFYDTYPNCLGPAFETAIATLTKRIELFGLESAAVREWVNGQDAVFANCGGRSNDQSAIIPSSVDPSLPQLIRKDRKYQIAAAHFYAGDFDAAVKQFHEIASDPQSPWHVIAYLLVARSLIRMGTVNRGEAGVNLELLRQAEAVLEEIIADPALGEVHAGAQRLQGLVQLRINPVERNRTLGLKLAKSGGSNVLQDLIDYTWQTGEGGVQQASQAQINLNSNTADPLTDWIATFQASDGQSLAHAIERWKQTGALAWLLAALTKSKSSDPHAAELIAAANKVGVNSPGYLTVTFQRLRLEAASGQRDLARQALDDLLNGKHSYWSRSDLNLFIALRMSLARNLEELLKFSVRIGTSYLANGEDYQPAQPALDDAESRKQEHEHEKEAAMPRFDIDGAWTLTRGLPTVLLVRAVEGDQLPRTLRAQVAESAWVRSVELGDERNALRLAPIVGQMEPRLAAEMKDFVAAQDSGSRRFSAILTILRMPGLRPYIGVGVSRVEQVQAMDRYGNNWWCGLGASKDAEDYEMWSELYSPTNMPEHPQVFDQFYEGGHVSYPSFLSAQERAAAKQEWSNIIKEGTGTQWLANEALVWAKAHPSDGRVPEGLHLAVRTLRYGCDRRGDSNLSRDAFDLLHRKYPKSEWTRKTPFWF